MKPSRVTVWGCALLLWGAAASSAEAAWCNVFQVCCFRCRRPAAVSYYYAAPAAVSTYAAPACPDPCPPQPVCTTRYVQRCYYQPVTTYQTRSYYEAVTTYRTSYYYEPVTSYRYSCYYDPCTCTYQQVACPTTSYRLRSQCCPVQSWVQRCCSVPVTTYQQAFYWEPQTTCCTPTCTTTAAPCPTPAPATAAPVAPGVSEQRSAPSGAGVQESPGGTTAPSYDRYYNPPSTNPPPATSGRSLRQMLPPLAVPRPAAPSYPAPRVRLDGIVAMPPARVEGQLVRVDNAPLARTRVMFVSAERRGAQEAVTTDAGGQFRVNLASGGWLIYVPDRTGRSAFHSKIDIRENEARRVTLVSR